MRALRAPQVLTGERETLASTRSSGASAEYHVPTLPPHTLGTRTGNEGRGWGLLALQPSAESRSRAAMPRRAQVRRLRLARNIPRRKTNNGRLGHLAQEQER